MSAAALRDRVTARRVAALVAALSGALVFYLATDLFPHLSGNHDEGVYLQQAEMLLAGRVNLYPPVPEAVRPWFFAEDGGRLYPKYTPVPAAMFAAARALTGEFRVALAAVAAGNAALCYAVTAEAFDRRTGVVAAVALVGAPLFLLTSSVFLSYAPASLLNWAFALAYVRAVRRESRRYAAGAGVAIGLAFFARPYTAVLFALPFVAHACLTLYRAGRRGREAFRAWVGRYAVVAAGGLTFVGATLAYNAAVTGSPLLFPYEAFAPLDGLGFGYRRILSHDLRYTPGLALRANAWVLWYFGTRWTVAGPVGTLLAGAGVAGLLVGRYRRRAHGAPQAAVARGDSGGPLPDHELRAVLAGLFVTVVAGNVAFWGNYNVLATFEDPTDGLIAVLGPFYHFDLLLPLSAFAASAAVAGWDRVRSLAAARDDDRRARVALLLVLAVTLPVVGAAERAAVEPPVERNADYTGKYERAYAPVEDADFENALVFVPTPYGEWLNHPFQSLRNDPDFDGPVVYAMDRDASGDFAVLDAYPNRTLYRYTYQGEWTSEPSERVIPKLERLERREAAGFDVETRAGVIRDAGSVTVRVESNGAAAEYAYEGDPGDEVAVSWSLTPQGASVDGEDLTRVIGNRTVPLNGTQEVVLSVTTVQRGGASVTYREEVTVRATDDAVEVVWPPERSVCNLVLDCEREGTYLPDRPETRVSGTWINSTLSARE